MSDAIAPNQTVTFTIKQVPAREAERKTIRRLMRLQPEVKRGLKSLQQRRRRHDNVPGRRAGVIWINRAKATKLTRVSEGEAFTIELTPQLMPDVRSVERYLDAQKAG